MIQSDITRQAIIYWLCLDTIPIGTEKIFPKMHQYIGTVVVLTYTQFNSPLSKENEKHDDITGGDQYEKL